MRTISIFVGYNYRLSKAPQSVSLLHFIPNRIKVGLFWVSFSGPSRLFRNSSLNGLLISSLFPGPALNSSPIQNHGAIKRYFNWLGISWPTSLFWREIASWKPFQEANRTLNSYMWNVTIGSFYYPISMTLKQTPLISKCCFRLLFPPIPGNALF